MSACLSLCLFRSGARRYMNLVCVWSPDGNQSVTVTSLVLVSLAEGEVGGVRGKVDL